jgi:hypothetical protein
MHAALDHLRTKGTPVPEEDLVHLSPARFEHVNPYGKYVFPIAQASQRQGPAASACGVKDRGDSSPQQGTSRQHLRVGRVISSREGEDNA